MKTNPSFNLNVVVRETGIKPDTLRAWERRYGMPNPSRTDGGHRLYSERDIGTILWLVERQNEGLRIKHAIDLWKEIENTGQDPLLIKPIGQPPSRKSETLNLNHKAFGELYIDWVNACLNFNETQAENITNYAFALNQAEIVLFELLFSGLVEIGKSWFRGAASVQQEHFASSLVVRRLNSLISSSPPPHKTGSILVGCPPGEDHTIPPLVITFMLKQRGWKTIYLGANIPKEKFEDTISSVKPIIAIMTAQHLASAASLVEISAHLSNSKIPLGFGGNIFVRNPNLHTKIPGHFLGDDLKTATNRIEEYLLSPTHKTKSIHISTKYQDAKDHYLNNLAEIEFQLNNDLTNRQLFIENLKDANRYLTSNIQAYIQLGDSESLEHEVEWIKDYFNYQNLNPHTLEKYLKSYFHVTKNILDKRGQPIIDCLSNIIRKFGDEI